MFILTKISDLVTIQPDQFSSPSINVLWDALNAKYANKVIPKVGLGICVHDVLNASDGVISQGDGAANVNVVFRLVVFRPFKGEVIVGQVGDSGDWGMRVKLQFFDDIVVPPSFFFENCEYDKQEKCWVWNNDGERYYFDKNDWIRVRVEDEHWHEPAPIAPNREHEPTTVRRSPYSIEVRMREYLIYSAESGLTIPGLDPASRSGLYQLVVDLIAFLLDLLKDYKKALWTSLFTKEPPAKASGERPIVSSARNENTMPRLPWLSAKRMLSFWMHQGQANEALLAYKECQRLVLSRLPLI